MEPSQSKFQVVLGDDWTINLPEFAILHLGYTPGEDGKIETQWQADGGLVLLHNHRSLPLSGAS